MLLLLLLLLLLPLVLLTQTVLTVPPLPRHAHLWPSLLLLNHADGAAASA